MRWRAVAEADLDEWDRRLAAGQAPLFQLPRWNRFIARNALRPLHLRAEEDGRVVAFATVVRVGVWPARFALVQRGPVVLDGGVAAERVVASLVQWARRRDDVLLRITSADPALLAAARTVRGAVDGDLFPAFPDDDHDLLVPQLDDAGATLARFTRSGRLAVRRGEKAGYLVRRGTAADLDATVVPMFERLADRKGFRTRPPEAFRRLFDSIASTDDGGVYLAELEGRAVGAILLVRDADTLRYVWGAYDRDALARRVDSPAALLHWVAMRDAHGAGVSVYNLGPGSPPSVAEFKLRFRPQRVEVEAVTVPTSGVRFLLWHRLGVPLLEWLWPRVQRLRGT